MTVFFINPFLEAAGGDFESIATVTVGSGGAANVEFTSIPSTYQHLQIRMIGRKASFGTLAIQFNGSTSSIYDWHTLYGNGGSVAVSAINNLSSTYIERVSNGSSTANVFGAGVIDVLDYASTSKNKTLRTIAGFDNNGSGFIYLNSGLWRSTSAVTSIKLDGLGENFLQYSTAALYGIKAP